MINRIVLLVVLFTLGLTAPVLAAEPGSSLIEGRVINGTEGAGSVAAQEITLKTYLNDTEVDSATTSTDAEGRFVFDGLSTESGYKYQITLTFQQADYTGDWLSFDDGETPKFTEVTVYDATTSDEAIKIAMAHTIIYIEEDSLWITEYFLFTNETDQTYIGWKELPAEGTRETLRFSLPGEATELQSELGLMECCIYDREDGFIDTMPVLPGGKEIVYSYRVAYNSGEYAFSRQVNYPTASYDLLIQGEGSQVISDRLASAEEMLDINGTLFNHVAGDNFVPGDILVARISGLPEAGDQRIIIWVMLTLVALAGGFSLGYYLLKKRQLQPVTPEGSLKQRRQRLLVELARLDDNFESGKINEEGYRSQRAEKKAQLVALTKKEKNGNR